MKSLPTPPTECKRVQTVSVTTYVSMSFRVTSQKLKPVLSKLLHTMTLGLILGPKDQRQRSLESKVSNAYSVIAVYRSLDGATSCCRPRVVFFLFDLGDIYSHCYEWTSLAACQVSVFSLVRCTRRHKLLGHQITERRSRNGITIEIVSEILLVSTAV